MQAGAEPAPSTPSPFPVSWDGRLDLTIGQDGAITLNFTPAPIEPAGAQ